MVSKKSYPRSGILARKDYWRVSATQFQISPIINPLMMTRNGKQTLEALLNRMKHSKVSLVNR